MEIKFNEILRFYSLAPPFSLEQIYKSAWLINNSFILKRNSDQKEVEKALSLNRHLATNGIPVADYMTTINGQSYVIFEDNLFTLMRKMNGEHIDPFCDDYAAIAYNIGIEIARLHKALKSVTNVDINDSDLINDINGWITSEIKSKNINVPIEIINRCLEFEKEYNLLPRQLIHRDIQFGNMLFENNRLIGFLDFDISQKNVRMFDIVYLVQSLLVGKYNNKDFIEKWIGFTDSLLKGYHSENELLNNEIKAIYEIALSIQLIFIAFFSSINEVNLVPNCIDMAKWILSNEEVFNFSFPIKFPN